MDEITTSKEQFKEKAIDLIAKRIKEGDLPRELVLIMSLELALYGRELQDELFGAETTEDSKN